MLFGLGFDTATEVALLAATAGAATAGLPWYAVLSLPILFAAGMATLDTLDGSFMNFAYGWAFSKPVRKVYYNITITGLSVAVAMLIGTIEIFGLLAAAAQLLRRLLGLHVGLQHQRGRVHHRRPVRRDLGRVPSRSGDSAASNSDGNVQRAQRDRPDAPRVISVGDRPQDVDARGADGRDDRGEDAEDSRGDRVDG